MDTVLRSSTSPVTPTVQLVRRRSLGKVVRLDLRAGAWAAVTPRAGAGDDGSVPTQA